MKVVITAGGTGGHIYPAISIINKIKEKEPNSEFIYIGTHNRMEKDIIPNLGIPYESIEIYGFSKTNIKQDIKNINLIRKAYQKSLNIIKEFKPDIVIGVGGYVTFPVILAAHKLKIKTFLHEQNSIPGKSNKLLIKFADKIGVSFEDTKKYFPKEKCILTGNPCSENALNIKPTSKTKYGLTYNKKSVLIVQGSLGSKVMNNKMIDFLSSIDEENYEVLYITGKNYYDEFNKNKFSKNVKIVPFIENLSSLLKDIDIMVTRAGASTISEITSLGIPSILIPSPYVANNHQYYNALSLKNNNACILIEEKDLNKDILKEKINYLLTNPETYNTFKKNLQNMSIPSSSTIIYNTIKDMIKWKRKRKKDLTTSNSSHLS